MSRLTGVIMWFDYVGNNLLDFYFNSPTIVIYSFMVFVVFGSHIPEKCIGCQPEKTTYTVANPARGLLNREKTTKEKVWQRTPTSHVARSE